MENRIGKTSPEFQMIAKLCFRLLPVQILLSIVAVANGTISSLFASNYIDAHALSAVGLYSSVRLFISAAGVLLLGGSQILVGKYMGKNQPSEAHNIFSLNMVVSILLGLLVSIVLAATAVFDLTKCFTQDVQVREHFNQYLLGSAIGIFPQLLGQQLSGFLSLENRTNRTIVASIVCVVATVALNYLFVAVLQLETFGLAAASSFGLWVFFLVEAQPYFAGNAELRFHLKNLRWEKCRQIVTTGLTGALSNGYLAIRSVCVNALLLHYVGAFGLSAFVACNSFLDFFWAIPAGMCAVSRMLISVSTGEEDRVSLQEIMRVMFFRFVPVMAVVAVVVCAAAEPLTYLYYQDPSEPVFQMTVWGFRILPLCMPLSVVCMHFVCYGQATNKHFLVHVLSVFDSLISVSLFGALLIPVLGIRGIYLANVINGVISIVIIVIYAWCCRKGFPKTMEALMTIPKEFGVPQENRIDITVNSMDDAVGVSSRIQPFCWEKGIDRRKAYFAALAVEEMVTVIVEHGFCKQKHAIVLRVACKGDRVILRIKDNCKPVDPAKNQGLMNPQDPTAHIGIRLVYSIAQDVKYQNILGMNTLTLKF